ncbi:hypothetical protein JCM8547_006567 [Rhodosporidiobolus lusitaniae]
MEDLEAQTGGSAASSTDNLALSTFSSPTSSTAPDPADDDDDQEDVSAPLLPQYTSKDPAEGVKPLGRLLRLAGFLLLFFFAVIVWYLLLLAEKAPVFFTLALPPLNSTEREDLLAPTRDFLRDPSTVNTGVIPFSSLAYSPLYRPSPLQHPLTTFDWPSPSCLEQYVATGELCSEAEKYWTGERAPKLDVMWTWVNGSSAEPMAEWRKKVSDEVGRSKRAKRFVVETTRKIWRRAAGASVVRHFREHDELRFSIRSILSCLPLSALSTLHIVASDTPAYSPYSPPTDSASNTTFDSLTTRLAQVPHWANLARLEFPGVELGMQRGGPSLKLHPPSELFKTPAEGNEETVEEAEEGAREWQNRVLPSFNSLAYESQLANLQTSAPTALYLNDDFFLMQSLTYTDVASPFSGLVFRMQRDLLVGGVSPADTHDDGDGEWRGLGYTAWLLDQRFGKRRRPYLIHVAKTFSPALMREMQQVWINELTATAAARFRGKAPSEAVALFLFTMYTIEKHREALLWSFLVARSDPDRSGTYSPSERQSLLSSLGISLPSISRQLETRLPVFSPSRLSLSSLPAARSFTGLPEAKQTSLEFSSMDGYAFVAMDEGMRDFHQRKGGWPDFSPPSSSDGKEDKGEKQPICTLDLQACFGDGFFSHSPSSPLVGEDETEIDVSSTFKRIAFEQPQCGDCLICLLLSQSGERGLEAFLPPFSSEDGNEEERAEGEEVRAEAIALDGTRWEELEFSPGLEGEGSLRRRAATFIHRYSYSIGSSPASFQSLKYGGAALSMRLSSLSSNPENRPALLALNDDFTFSNEASAKDANRRMKEWFEEVWPEKSPWEAD